MRLLRPLLTGAVLAVSLTACDAQPSTDSAPQDKREVARENARAYYGGLATCLEDAGFPASFDPEAMSLQVPVSPEQHHDLESAEANCRAELGPAPQPPGWSDEELADLYRQSVEAFRCLTDQGFQPAEPPSLETFMADYRSGGIKVPYLPHMNPERGPDVMPSFPDEACPLPTLTP